MKIQISIILFTIMIYQTNADENLIQTTCKNTQNYQVCVNTLHANPKSATEDVAGLALIVVAAVKSNTQKALSTANNLLKSGQPKLSGALQKYLEAYKAVIESDVPVAEKAVRGNPKFAETAIQDAANEAEVCENGFKGVVAPSPLSGDNKNIIDLGTVARAIIRNLL